MQSFAALLTATNNDTQLEALGELMYQVSFFIFLVNSIGHSDVCVHGHCQRQLSACAKMK